MGRRNDGKQGRFSHYGFFIIRNALSLTKLFMNLSLCPTGDPKAARSANAGPINAVARLIEMQVIVVKRVPRRREDA